MAIIRNKEINKLNSKEKEDKLIELRLELVRSYVGVNKTNAKTKEIKRAISRLLTSKRNMKNTSKEDKIAINKSAKEELKNK